MILGLITKQMIEFLDGCKQNCECSGVLKFNPNETNELKKWLFIYQCDENKEKSLLQKKKYIR